MFENILGNDGIKQSILQSIKSGNISHSYLFVGKSGIGKKLFAKEIAKKVMCLGDKTCESCIKFDANSNPDFTMVVPDGKSIKIEQIRNLQSKIIEKPIISSRKVYIINNAEKMTVEAQNCLLKTLEEPPEFVTIILVSNNENTILTTIKSRCTKVAFTEETKKEITEENKERFENLEKIFGNVERYLSIDLLNKIDELYKEKDNIFENLEYINEILIKKARQDEKYLDYIDYVEETKNKLKSNSNYDMCIDNLILKIWE